MKTNSNKKPADLRIWVIANPPYITPKYDEIEEIKLIFTYSYRQLIAEAKARNIHLKLVTSDLINIKVANNQQGTVYINNKQFDFPDYIIPRTGSKATNATLSLLRHFESYGVPMLNTSTAIQTSIDKFYQLQLFAQNGIPIPKTMLVSRRTDVDIVVEEIGLPAVIKTTPSTSGRGVSLVYEKSALNDYIQLIFDVNPQANVFVQEYIEHREGTDVRVFVLDGKAINTVKRSAANGFKANLDQGGTAVPFTLPAAAEEMAIKAAEVLNLDYAGVDLLFLNEEEFVLCEVNPAPGFLVNDRASGSNLASTIYEHLINKLSKTNFSEPKTAIPS